MVQGLLRGTLPPRPLFVPIVFALGARVENQPLRAYLGNPTKISNALRQMRSHLRSDGVSCYFDPCLETEALGGTRQWDEDGQRPRISWPQPAARGELPRDLRTPEEAAKSAPVTVATEVIRRLKPLLRDQPLLMAGVAGPFTLAARLTQLEREPALRREDLPNAALDLSAAVITKVAGALVEAGANLIFIQEEVLPALSPQNCQSWASWLAPVINVIRFYEALPVLQITNISSFAENRDLIFQQHWNAIVCPALEAISSPPLGKASIGAMLGVALPVEVFLPNGPGSKDLGDSLDRLIGELQPAILTTAGDVPAATDTKRLNQFGGRFDQQRFAMKGEP